MMGTIRQVRLYGGEPYRAAVIHGGPGAPGSVAAVARELCRRLGLGMMEPLQSALTVDGQIEELHQTIVAHGGGPMVLVGHSWGAWLSVLYAARYPEWTRKLVLVGSGPFEQSYVEELHQTRLGRLSRPEKEEFDRLLARLGDSSDPDPSGALARLGALVSKTDDFELVPAASEREKTDLIATDGGQYESVWNEAAAMRQSGELVRLARSAACPIAAIHGAYDPHPADGVKLPLKDRAAGFRFFLLDRCGHSPWKELYARERFYEIVQEEILD